MFSYHIDTRIDFFLKKDDIIYMLIYEYIDKLFLDNLRKDTFEVNPNLISELFNLYFEILPEKMSALKIAISKNNDLEALSLSHYLKGQSSCVGFVYYADKFSQIENFIKEKKLPLTINTLNDISSTLPRLKFESENYLSSL